MRKPVAPRSGAVLPDPSVASPALTPPEEGAATAAYVADMAMQLADLAERARLKRVGYLLTLAAIEAQLTDSAGETASRR